MRPTASRLRALVVLAAAAAVVLGGAGAAQAHNTLVSTDPTDGSTVAVAPARVTLTFNEPARSLGTQIVVTGPDGGTVSVGDAVLVDSAVSQDVSGSLPAGAYTVTWRVTSADGHPLDGVLSFTASGATTVGGEPAATVPPTPAPTPSPTSTSTPTSTAPTADTSIQPVTPTGGTTLAPVAPDQNQSADAGFPAWVVVAGLGVLIVIFVVSGALLIGRRRARPGRSPEGRA
ncbi:MAG: copper resistance CopC family protein [Cellulomonas sp.]